MTLLLSQLGSGATSKISDKLGVEDDKVQQVIGMALPVIIGALNRNASSTKGGAEALTNAVQRDHDGSILDNLADLITKRETVDDGTAILGHIFGDKGSSVMNNVSRAANVDNDQTAQIFAMLAPIVLGALGKIQRKNDLDADGVSSLLQDERKTVEKSTSGLTQLLDMDGDGDVSEEIISLGANLLGGLLGGKK
jgi:hypothetical protein